MKVIENKNFYEIFSPNIPEHTMFVLITAGLAHNHVEFLSPLFLLSTPLIQQIWRWLLFNTEQQTIVIQILHQCLFLYDQDIQDLLLGKYLFIIEKFVIAKKLPNSSLSSAIGHTKDLDVCEYLIFTLHFQPFEKHDISWGIRPFVGDMFDTAVATGCVPWCKRVFTRFHSFLIQKKNFKASITFCFTIGSMNMLKYFCKIGVDIYDDEERYEIILFLFTERRKKLILKNLFLPKCVCKLINNILDQPLLTEIKTMCILTNWKDKFLN